MIDEVLSEGIGAILRLRINAFELTDIVSIDGMLFWLTLGIDNPGKLMLYLVELVDYYSKNDKPATLEDIVMHVYPDGFYDSESGSYVIDNIIKNKKATNSTIYTLN